VVGGDFKVESDSIAGRSNTESRTSKPIIRLGIDAAEGHSVEAVVGIVCCAVTFFFGMRVKDGKGSNILLTSI
jgi:hypothetical protein